MYCFPYLEPVCVQIYILRLNFAYWNLIFTWFFEFLHVLDKTIFAYFLPDVLYFDISVLFYDPISYCITKEIFAITAAAAAAKSLQSCPTLCDPIDGSPPGSPVPGILQARTLEWVAVSFPNVWKRKLKVKLLSRVRLLATPWTTAYQAPLSMGFSRQSLGRAKSYLPPEKFHKYKTDWNAGDQVGRRGREVDKVSN